MQALELEQLCVACSKTLVDAGDEFVCPGCGAAMEKQVEPAFLRDAFLAPTMGRQALGSYMGSHETTREERRSKGIAGSGSRYEYLKVVSDFAGRSEGTAGVCAKMVERVCEKLYLPGFVLNEAVAISKKILAERVGGRRVTAGAVSAYALIAACKVSGVTSVSVREIISAHSDLGRKVTSSSIIQLALASPIKTRARSPEDYLSRVLARLARNERLAKQLVRERVGQEPYFRSLREMAGEILAMLGEDERAGRRPSALAASAVYSAESVLARRESRSKRITQRDVAECGDTAEYTIREQCASIFSPLVNATVSRRSQTLPSGPTA